MTSPRRNTFKQADGALSTDMLDRAAEWVAERWPSLDADDTRFRDIQDACAAFASRMLAGNELQLHELRKELEIYRACTGAQHRDSTNNDLQTMSVRRAALSLGYSQKHVYALLYEKKLAGVNVNGVWRIPASTVEARKAMRKPSRKSSPKPSSSGGTL